MINRLWWVALAVFGLGLAAIFRSKLLMAFFAGWLVPFILKYIVFGLNNWDMTFHQERLQADVTGPYQAFSKPFFGAFQ